MSALERLYNALQTPSAARVDRWVPKSKLVEGGALSSTDRRLVEAGVERLHWRATLRPASVGVPAFEDESRRYAEIVVMTAQLRTGAKGARLAEIVHRTVTPPLVLCLADEGGAVLSVGLKRRHEREEAANVVERFVESPPVADGGNDIVERTFLDSLDLGALPVSDLWGLHSALAERAEAFAAARATGGWRLAADAEDGERRRAALTDLDTRRREIARLRRVAAGEKRLAARIDLSHQVARAEAELKRTLDQLT